jgi:SAM-dependent methyltransferase
MDLREVATGIDPEHHWYYQTKKIPLLRSFGTCVGQAGHRLDVLDIGAGSGFFSRALLETFDDRIGRIIMVDKGYDQEEISRENGDRIERVRALPETISNSFIVMMDVLEHIEDDSGFLADIGRRSKGQNYFFVTVPAFDSLWSNHDEFLGHYRRYSRTGLVNLLRHKGFRVDQAYYLYASIFPVVYLLRKLRRTGAAPRSDLKPARPIVNNFLKSVIGLECRIARINTLFGLTCVVEGSLLA